MRARTLIHLRADLLLPGSVAFGLGPIVIGEINPPGALVLQGWSVHPGFTVAVEERNACGATPVGEPRSNPPAALDLRAPLGRVKFDDKVDPPFDAHAIAQFENGHDLVTYPAVRAGGPASPS